MLGRGHGVTGRYARYERLPKEDQGDGNSCDLCDPFHHCQGLLSSIFYIPIMLDDTNFRCDGGHISSWCNSRSLDEAGSRLRTESIPDA